MKKEILDKLRTFKVGDIAIYNNTLVKITEINNPVGRATIKVINPKEEQSSGTYTVETYKLIPIDLEDVDELDILILQKTLGKRYAYISDILICDAFDLSRNLTDAYFLTVRTKQQENFGRLMLKKYERILRIHQKIYFKQLNDLANGVKVGNYLTDFYAKFLY